MKKLKEVRKRLRYEKDLLIDATRFMVPPNYLRSPRNSIIEADEISSAILSKRDQVFWEQILMLQMAENFFSHAEKLICSPMGNFTVSFKIKFRFIRPASPVACHELSIVTWKLAPNRNFKFIDFNFWYRKRSAVPRQLSHPSPSKPNVGAADKWIRQRARGSS